MSAILFPLVRPDHAVETHAIARHPAEHDALGRYPRFRKSFPMIELALPAKALRDHLIAKRARQHGVAVDVRTSEELGIAVANGIKPTRIVVHGAELSETALGCAANLGVGRMIVSSDSQIEFLGSRVQRRIQGVLVSMSCEADAAIREVLAHRRLRLEGLSVGASAAIGNVIAEMAHIRRHYGMVLTGLALDCDVWCGSSELPEIATDIDDAVEDGCATQRFPRPRVLLSTGMSSPTPVNGSSWLASGPSRKRQKST